MVLCLLDSEQQNKIDDPRYINLCVENINYTPILLEEVLERTKNGSSN